MTALYVIAFLSSFAFVFVKAFQQLNVVHGLKLAAFLTAYLMALFEVLTLGALAYQFATVGINALWMVIPIGTGGGLGVISSMWVHKRMRSV